MSEIKPGLKVSLNGENGVVLDSDNEGFGSYGMIRWDTNEKDDVDDWRGVFGTLFDMGGFILEDNFEFKFINSDGSLKV